MKTNFLIISMVLILNSCDKKAEPPNAYIAQETKDFCVFQKGTWWEYENTRTNEIDIWKIQNILNRFAEQLDGSHKQKLVFLIEDIQLHVTTLQNDSFFLNISGGVTFSTNKYFGLHQLSYYDNGLDSMFVCNNLKIKTISRDSMDGKCVLKAFKYNTYPCTTFFPSYTKWERHKGITEMAYYNGDTLRLKSSNIIQ